MMGGGGKRGDGMKHTKQGNNSLSSMGSLSSVAVPLLSEQRPLGTPGILTVPAILSPCASSPGGLGASCCCPSRVHHNTQLRFQLLFPPVPSGLNNHHGFLCFPGWTENDKSPTLLQDIPEVHSV